MWWVTTQKNGASALGLQRVLGLKAMRQPGHGCTSFTAQEDGAGIGRIRLRQIVDASAQSLVPFVRESVVAGSTVHTDGWLGYLPLKSSEYQHEVTCLKGSTKTAS